MVGLETRRDAFGVRIAPTEKRVSRLGVAVIDELRVEVPGSHTRRLGSSKTNPLPGGEIENIKVVQIDLDRCETCKDGIISINQKGEGVVRRIRFLSQLADHRPFGNS